MDYKYISLGASVATKYSKKYLVRVLLNLFQKVFSTSTLRGGFQKYLVRVLNTLEILEQKINLIKIYI